jgi:hypothetical protein
VDHCINTGANAGERWTKIKEGSLMDNNLLLVEYLEGKKLTNFPTKSFESKAGSGFVER